MKRQNQYLLVAVVTLLCAVSSISFAATIFESATLGATGLSIGDVVGENVTTFAFSGVRFQTTQPSITTEIGGHFLARSSGTFFGAIVALDDQDDFPDSSDLSTSDVLGTTTLTFPVPSAEVFGDLSLSLDPGWYAVVFGSGLFETLGFGGAPSNEIDIGMPSYFGFLSGSGWGDRLSGKRYVVKGNVIPEPATILLACIASLPLLFFRLPKIS